MKEPVLFKGVDRNIHSESFPLVQNETLHFRAGEKRFVFIEVRDATGSSKTLIEAGENSDLEIVFLQNISNEHECISLIQLKLGKNAKVKLSFIQNGGNRAHLELITEVLGADASVEIHGLQNAKQKQKLSFEAKSIHSVPHTKSSLNIWCIANDESQSIFNGVITIEKGAHHTEAYQKNKNLLLSDSATIDTFPKLFIWNDDVKCAHGSSVSQLEADQFYYLQTRGIAQEQAEKMLLAGFMHQALDWITDESTRKKLENVMGLEEEIF